MASTPARRHFQKVTAEQDALDAVDNAGLRPDASQYELMLAQLAVHQRQLKQTQSIEKRAEIKRDKILPEYDDYIDGVITAAEKSGQMPQDDVLMTVMAWSVDAGDLDNALRIADHAIPHGLVMPERFNREPSTFLADQISEAIMENPAEKSAPGLMKWLHGLMQDQDIPDQARAKVHKAYGLALQTQDVPRAVEHLDRALQLNKQAGVKKLADKLRKQIDA